MRDRKSILQEIAAYKSPDNLPQLRAELAQHKRDMFDPVINLSHQDIISILERFLAGELTAKQVEDWADSIEMRDDVEYGVKDDAAAIGVMAELGGPLEPLTEDFAKKLILSLRAV